MIALTVPLLLALTWLVRSTRQGKAMRATSQDMEAAAMMGINVNRTISFTFALAGGLAGAAGLIYVLQFTTIRFDQGFQLGLIAFTAAVLGGIGNLAGAVLGGVLIGLVEAFVRRARLGLAGRQLDPRDRLHGPHRRPRVQAGRPARRADAGGSVRA